MANYTYGEHDHFVQLRAERDYHETIAGEKGEAFREYRKRWDSAGRFELETIVPLHVDIELSTYCNFKCPMCPFGIPKNERPDTFDNASGFFPFSLFQKIVDEGVPKGLCAIDLSYYNEPLLHKDLLSFIEYAGKNGVLDIMLSTNAQLLTPEITEALLDSPLTRFMVSLDAGTMETFQQIRKGGDYAKVIANLEHFLTRKKERKQTLPVTRVSFVKTSLNEGELEDFIAHWEPLVDYLSIQELMRFDTMAANLSPATRFQNLDFKCHQPWHRLTIRANGDALPCCTIWGQQLSKGNVAHESLEVVWNSPPMRELRQLHREGRYAENPVCKKCAESSVVA